MIENMDAVKQTKSNVINEGSAEIISGGHVFYNPVQEFNRDLSVSVLNVFSRKFYSEKQQKKNKKTLKENPNLVFELDCAPGTKCDDGIRILEALSATGLRSIRYANEIVGIKEVIANDLSRKAVESITDNIKHNNVDHIISPSHSDAMTLMYMSTAPEKRFDVVDLDPYGCPNRFLDGAIQSLVDGGLLLVTATDMAVLAGNAPEACFVKYGSVPLRNKACHEMALRILLKCIEGHANRYGKYIEPMLSISADFYVRIFVRVYSSQIQCKYSMSKQSMVYQCTGCETLTLHPLGVLKPNPTENNPKQVKFGIPTGPPVDTKCIHCDQKHHLGGPIWSAPIHNKEFVMELLKHINTQTSLGTYRRLVGMLSVVAEELTDVPLYYSVDKLCSVVKLEIVPVLKFRSALLHAGYQVSFSHAYKNSIKTDAPAYVLWDILRCWNKSYPVKEDRMVDRTPIKNILSKQSPIEYDFELHPNANPDSRKNALARFPENPTPHWGPGTRATIMIGEDKLQKSYRNQNKNKKKANNALTSEKNAKQIKLEKDSELMESC